MESQGYAPGSLSAPRDFGGDQARRDDLHPRGRKGRQESCRASLRSDHQPAGGRQVAPGVFRVAEERHRGHIGRQRRRRSRACPAGRSCSRREGQEHQDRGASEPAAEGRRVRLVGGRRHRRRAQADRSADTGVAVSRDRDRRYGATAAAAVSARTAPDQHRHQGPSVADAAGVGRDPSVQRAAEDFSIRRPPNQDRAER